MNTRIFGTHRAATDILTKIRNFRDLRTCQNGPKSDQKGTTIMLNTKLNVTTNHIMVTTATVHDHILDIKNVNILI